MKKWIVILFWFCCVSSVCARQEEPTESTAQRVAEPLLGQSLSWLVGTWSGEGTQAGRTFTSRLEISSILDSTAVLAKRSSSGGYAELMLLGYDSSSKKNVGTLYDNRYHTGLYTCTATDKELICSQVVSVKGYASQRKYQLNGDGTLTFTIERQEPDQQLRKVIEVVFKKIG